VERAEGVTPDARLLGDDEHTERRVRGEGRAGESPRKRG